ncbi:MAG TPA: Wzz/FepE/Etk N-terminal domain-containing protein [Acetivibrio sp.]|uniref:YveK family protein n=1 Tax=Acetivibrio sp. TaxID=1872092 RepID=UPI002C36BE86|nr:Wzz/FepE/Etk N-terminal domain-containing protein [Acetivibrio sp.]HOM02471.1 Wzz/FepE/Etk N-terminal domain-containing protein [Acetivibrio sp.]
MELKQFLIMIRKKLVFIILVPIVVSIITALISSLFIPPLYESSSTLYIISQNAVSEEDVTYNELLKNQQLVKDYRELIKSKLIVKAALEELGITDISPEQLSERITVASKSDTRVLEVKVRDTYPERSMELSNKICEVFVRESVNITKISNVSIVDAAVVPRTPVEPKPMLYTLIALLISLCASIGVFYLFEILNETIKTSEDVRAYLELNVLGTIPTFNIK